MIVYTENFVGEPSVYRRLTDKEYQRWKWLMIPSLDRALWCYASSSCQLCHRTATIHIIASHRDIPRQLRGRACPCGRCGDRVRAEHDLRDTFKEGEEIANRVLYGRLNPRRRRGSDQCKPIQTVKDKSDPPWRHPSRTQTSRRQPGSCP